MPVYRTQNRTNASRKKLRPLPLILMIVVAVALVAVAVAMLWGGAAEDAVSAQSQNEEATSGEGPTAALEAIYEQNDTRGVTILTNIALDEQYGISSDIYLKAWGRVTDGIYGIADVFIFRTLEGQEDALREALEQVKTNRIVETRNYDIYNSLEYAEGGQIFEVGDDYLCLIMIENADQVREILESYLTQK